MAKMNMQAVASKVGGMAAGVMAGGVVANYLKKNNFSPLYGSIGMVVAGAYLPKMAGEKPGGMLGHMGDALIVKGLNNFLVDKFSFLAGPDDEVSGPYDDSVSGYPTADEVIVSGPYEVSDSVSGIGQFVN